MSKYLTGSKRLQVIQNYLNGRDDPEFEVFPTKKENKYIVKRRIEPLKEQPKEIVNEQHDEGDSIEEPVEEPITPPKPNLSAGTSRKTKPIAPPKSIPPPISNPSSPLYDPTLGVEILNQLKLLGEEMKKEREKKEQKRMVKDVVHKEMRKSKYQYTQPQYIQEPNQTSFAGATQNEIDEPIEDEPQQVPQPIYRKRNNIFADMG